MFSPCVVPARLCVDCPLTPPMPGRGVPVSVSHTFCPGKPRLVMLRVLGGSGMRAGCFSRAQPTSLTYASAVVCFWFGFCCLPRAVLAVCCSCQHKLVLPLLVLLLPCAVLLLLVLLWVCYLCAYFLVSTARVWCVCCCYVLVRLLPLCLLLCFCCSYVS